MSIAKIPAILSTLTNLSYIRKRIFNGTGFSINNKKHSFLTMHSFFRVFFYNFMKLPKWFI